MTLKARMLSWLSALTALRPKKTWFSLHLCLLVPSVVKKKAGKTGNRMSKKRHLCASTIKKFLCVYQCPSVVNK